VPSSTPKGRPPQAKHIDALRENLDEVVRLLEIHTQIAGPTVGAKHNVEVLNKSGIVLLVACWEAFVEDLATSAFKLLLRRAQAPRDFPTKVLIAVSKRLREGDERRIWDLAGEGWKTVLRQHQDSNLKRIRSFHTPKPSNIDDLFESLFGITKITKKWSWRQCTPARARARLEALVKLRGEIAHRVSVGRSVRKKDVAAAGELILRLAAATHNAVNKNFGNRFGHLPWAIAIVGSPPPKDAERSS
jgi:hypothetical protein